MPHDTPLPPKIPEPGFYYHYKHDPEGPVNNYAYYIFGIGHHTEDDCRPEDAFMLVYRPLYESYVYKNGKMFDLRPLAMFYEPAKDGRERFVRIADPETLSRLEKIKNEMYPEA
jgi:hypothetical protein